MSGNLFGFSLGFRGSGAGGKGAAAGVKQTVAPPPETIDPKANPARMAAIGDHVRKVLKANPAVEDLGGESADLFRVRNFLGRNECRRLVRVIDSRIGPSPLFEGTEIEGFRTSSTHYFDREDPETIALERKLDDLLGLEGDYAETTQGQRYMPGQQFKHHHDFFHVTENYWQTERRRGGQRTWTAMVYLNEPEEGGATDFRDLGLAIPPERGTLLTWNNMDRQGRPALNTVHAGTPVVAGSKYIITQWYRQDPWTLHMV